MTGWNRRGEAVMVVMMGVMVIAGLVLWLTRGSFHMMPMGGGHGHGSHGAPAPAAGDHGHGQAGAPSSPAEEHGHDEWSPEVRPGGDTP